MHLSRKMFKLRGSTDFAFVIEYLLVRNTGLKATCHVHSLPFEIKCAFTKQVFYFVDVKADLFFPFYKFVINTGISNDY